MANWINQWGNTYLIVTNIGDLPSIGNSIGSLAVVTSSSTLYEWNGSSWSMIASPGATPLAITSLTGNVTSSGPGASSATVVSVGGSTAANINSATQLVLTSQSANKFLSSPASGSGSPTFRSIVSSDIPTLNQNTTGSSASAAVLTGNLTGPITSVGMATSVANNAVINSMLAQMNGQTIKGNALSSSGNPSDLTMDVVSGMLTSFSASAQGVVPASGGGSSKYLRADGWAFLPNSYSRNIQSISSSQTLSYVLNVDQYAFVSGITTITLPSAIGNSNLYCVKNVGSGTVTINTILGQTIDGQSSISVAVKYTSITFLSDGSNWNVV